MHWCCVQYRKDTFLNTRFQRQNVHLDKLKKNTFKKAFTGYGKRFVSVLKHLFTTDIFDLTQSEMKQFAQFRHNKSFPFFQEKNLWLQDFLGTIVATYSRQRPWQAEETSGFPLRQDREKDGGSPCQNHLLQTDRKAFYFKVRNRLH